MTPRRPWLSALVLVVACDPAGSSSERESPRIDEAAVAPEAAKEAKAPEMVPVPAPEPTASHGIDQGLAANIVEGMNELCPDSWCEGAFDWHFSKLDCDAKRCTLHFAAQYEAREIPVAGAFVFELPSGAVEGGEETMAFWDALNPALMKWEDAQRKNEEAKDPDGKGWEGPPTCPPLYLLGQLHAAAFFFEHGPVAKARAHLQIAERYARGEPGAAQRPLDMLKSIDELVDADPEAAKARTQELRLYYADWKCLPEPVHELLHADLPAMP